MSNIIVSSGDPAAIRDTSLCDCREETTHSSGRDKEAAYGGKIMDEMKASVDNTATQNS